MLTRSAITTRTATPTVSVVIPTFNEAGNVDELLRRLAEALPAGAEVVVVDDSTDDTADRARAAAPAVPFTLTVIHRDEPAGGLGGAVVEGLRAAQADWAVVMDGDLQHPPAVVAELLAAGPGHDVVVATRYAQGGDGSGLGSPYRHAVSRGSKALAARLLGGAVAQMSDPLSGFFAVRRAALDLDAVDPIGYKILLELVVRSGLDRIAEVPFTFGTRHAEESKSTAREGMRFLQHLRTLRLSLRERGRAQRVVTPTSAPIRLDDYRRATRENSSPRLEVLIVTSEAPPIVSGISRCVDRLTGGLRERGHRVDVLSSVQMPRLMLGEYRFSPLVAYWRQIGRLLENYDVVNLHGPVPTMSDLVLLLAGAHRGTPILYTHHSALAVRGAETLSKVYNRLHRILSGRADRILTTSDHYADLERRAGGPPVEVVPWGVDVRPQPLRPVVDGAPLRVLFVGQMRPYKGLEWLIPAVAGRPGLELTLIGDGAHRAEYEALAGSADNVLFTGRVSDDDLHRAYDTHDVVVLPSVTQAEAFGLVVLEGMAAGCVPVVSDLPGVRDLVADTGLVVGTRNVDALAAALDGLAADRSRLVSLGRRARRRAEGLGWDTCVERYEAAMIATVADRGRVLPAARTTVPAAVSAPSATVTKVG